MNFTTPKKNKPIDALLHPKSQLRTQSTASKCGDFESSIKGKLAAELLQMKSPRTPSSAAQSSNVDNAENTSQVVDKIMWDEAVVFDKLKELSNLKIQKNLHLRETKQKLALSKQKLSLCSRKMKALQNNEASRIEEIQDLDRIIESLIIKFQEMKVHTKNMTIDIDSAQKTLISEQAKCATLKNVLENGIVKKHKEITEKREKLGIMRAEANQQKKVSEEIKANKDKLDEVRNNIALLKGENDSKQQSKYRLIQLLNDMDLKLQSQKERLNSLILKEKVSQNESKREIAKLQEKKAKLLEDQSQSEKDLAEKQSNISKFISLVEFHRKELQDQKEALENYNSEKLNLLNKLQKSKEELANSKNAHQELLNDYEKQLHEEEVALKAFQKEKEDEENALQNELETLHCQVEKSCNNTKEILNVNLKLHQIQEKNKQMETEHRQHMIKLTTEYKSIIRETKKEENKCISIEQMIKQAEINGNYEIIKLQKQLKQLEDDINKGEKECNDLWCIVPTQELSRKYESDSDSSDSDIDYEKIFAEKLQSKQQTQENASNIKVLSNKIIQQPIIKLSKPNITDADKTKAEIMKLSKRNTSKTGKKNDYELPSSKTEDVQESPNSKGCPNSMKKKPVYMTMPGNSENDGEMDYDFSLSNSQGVSRSKDEVPISPVPKARKSLSFLKRL